MGFILSFPSPAPTEVQNKPHTFFFCYREAHTGINTVLSSSIWLLISLLHSIWQNLNLSSVLCCASSIRNVCEQWQKCQDVNTPLLLG